jgi:hypothetical protein
VSQIALLVYLQTPNDKGELILVQFPLEDCVATREEYERYSSWWLDGRAIPLLLKINNKDQAR